MDQPQWQVLLPVPPKNKYRCVHVAATYNNNTGENSLYINGVLNKSQNIGVGHLITEHGTVAWMGGKGDRYFKGKIAKKLACK